MAKAADPKTAQTPPTAQVTPEEAPQDAGPTVRVFLLEHGPQHIGGHVARIAELPEALVRGSIVGESEPTTIGSLLGYIDREYRRSLT